MINLPAHYDFMSKHSATGEGEKKKKRLQTELDSWRYSWRRG